MSSPDRLSPLLVLDQSLIESVWSWMLLKQRWLLPTLTISVKNILKQLLTLGPSVSTNKTQLSESNVNQSSAMGLNHQAS
jgi:hypothetical protein